MVLNSHVDTLKVCSSVCIFRIRSHDHFTETRPGRQLWLTLKRVQIARQHLLARLVTFMKEGLLLLWTSNSVYWLLGSNSQNPKAFCGWGGKCVIFITSCGRSRSRDTEKSYFFLDFVRIWMRSCQFRQHNPTPHTNHNHNNVYILSIRRVSSLRDFNSFILITIKVTKKWFDCKINWSD